MMIDDTYLERLKTLASIPEGNLEEVRNLLQQIYDDGYDDGENSGYWDGYDNGCADSCDDDS